jgi:hypothetical protein
MSRFRNVNTIIAYFKRSCQPAVFALPRDACAALPFRRLSSRFRPPKLKIPFVSANPRDDAGSISSPTFLIFQDVDSGSELYPASDD